MISWPAIRSTSARNRSNCTRGAPPNAATAASALTNRCRRSGESSPTGIPFLAHDEGFALVKLAHDLAAVIAQLAPSDLSGRTGKVARMLRRTLNVYVPDELAERARLRGLNVSALTQAVIAGELERASLSMARRDRVGV